MRRMQPRQDLGDGTPSAFCLSHDVVNKALFQQKFGALEVFRQLLVDGLLDHALTGEADERASGSATNDVGRGTRTTRVTPPSSRVGEDASNTDSPRRQCRLHRAAEALAICISERMPSCIRAPPETVYADDRQALFGGQFEEVRVSFSPMTLPIEPIMKLRHPSRRQRAGEAAHRRRAGDDALPLARFRRRPVASFWLIAGEIDAVFRASASRPVLVGSCPSSQISFRRLAGAHAQMVAAVCADRQVRPCPASAPRSCR